MPKDIPKTEIQAEKLKKESERLKKKAGERIGEMVERSKKAMPDDPTKEARKDIDDYLERSRRALNESMKRSNDQ